MSDNQITKNETRTFEYTKGDDNGFKFEVDVSDPSMAIAEITDFIDLMERAMADLAKLKETFTKQIESEDSKKKDKKDKKN